MNAELSRDPIIGAARVAAACDVCSPADTADWYVDVRDTIRLRVAAVSEEPELRTADEVIAPLATLRTSTSHPLPTPGHDTRDEPTERLTMAQSINRCLAELLDGSDDVIVFGEDVGRKGGAYGVTRGLQKRFGEQRVFDMLLDEQSILGMALGASLNGRLPDPGDPVPGLSPQRRGPTARRGGDARLLLQRPVPESDGRAHRRVRLPEGLRRPLPQRQLDRRAARHPRPRDRVAGPSAPTPHRCCGRASHTPGRPVRCACSWSRSPATTTPTCTNSATAAGHRHELTTTAELGRAHRSSTARRRTVRPHDRHLGQRHVSQPARPAAPGGRTRDPVPRRRPALDRAAPGRRHGRRSRGDRARARRRRDATLRRGR